MACAKPFMLGAMACPCGRCTGCRVARRRVWAHRILLESFKHGDSCFCTLTYDDAHVPVGLVKEDYQRWLKRLRRAVFPRKIRYFLAGERGDISGRPHFHAAVFGLDRVSGGGVDGQGGVVQSSWCAERSSESLGFTQVGELNDKSAYYLAGYVTKKISGILPGVKEFSRMSLRPGIGAPAMGDVSAALGSDVGLDAISAEGDVPHSLRHGRRLLPLGRYLRGRLRVSLGFAGSSTPVEAQRMHALRQAAEVAEARAEFKAQGYKEWEVEKLMLDTRLQKFKNVSARLGIAESKRSLR